MAATTVSVSGDLNFSQVKSQQSRLQSQIKQESSDIIELNLSKVSQCDSAGLALLVELKKFSQGVSKQLVIVDSPDSVRALATFCGLEMLLEQK